MNVSLHEGFEGSDHSQVEKEISIQQQGAFGKEMVVDETSSHQGEGRALTLLSPNQKDCPKPFINFSGTNNELQPGNEILSSIQEIPSTAIDSKKPFSLDFLSGSVGSEMNKQMAYFGSPEEAVEDLKKIKSWLGTESLDLHFQPTTHSLAKTAWYHFLVDSKQASQLINAIAEKIIAHENSIPFKDHQERSKFLQTVLLPLKRYLSFDLTWRAYDLLEGQTLDAGADKEVELLDFNPIDEKQLAVFLKEHRDIEVDLEHVVGRGGWGWAYPATSQGKEEVVKIAKTQVGPLLDRNSSYKKWSRDHELAASRLELRNLVKTDLIFLRIQTENGTRHYVMPPHQAKKFEQGPLWKRFLEIDPTTQVSVIAQVMERAPGESLHQLLYRGDTLEPGSAPFNSFLNGCCSFIEDAMYANFVHLDMKPQNIYFEQKQGVLTLIDTNLSARGARRYYDEKERLLKTTTKTDQPLTNPRIFNYLSGSVGHRPSKQRAHKLYGAEINGERLMMLALQLISREDYATIRGLKDSSTKPFLLHYLDQLDPNSKTVQTLKAHPEIKEVMDLTFQLAQTDSEDLEKMEIVFKSWQEAFHRFQQKYGYEERTDFSTIHRKEL